MNLILFGLALIAFLEVNYPDTHGQYVNVCYSDFECEELYIERDESGMITKEALERLGAIL